MIGVTYYVAASLDGFIAESDGGIDWLDVAEAGDEDYGYAEFFAGVDCLAMGRATFDVAMGYGSWLYGEHPCWVWTHRPIDNAPEPVRITTKPPVEVVAEAEAAGLRHLWLVGGGQLATAFRDAGLVTRMIVSVIPTTLGRGLPLFAASKERQDLQLEDCRRYDSGVVQLNYAVKP
ncbi:MAG: dihydrofolate reductase family protein [Acidobacteriota bacterium]